MSAYENIRASLAAAPKTWLISGVAGFIGSHLLETLLDLEQRVIGLDNYSTGSHDNLEAVRQQVGPEPWKGFAMIQGDVRDFETCRAACHRVDVVLHQAALGSVPRSLSAPLESHTSNAMGFLNMLVAARNAGIKRVVYASSSSVYGDHPDLPKVEGRTGKCLSPYAVTKCVNEVYAELFGRCYGVESVGLRYFNVFGPRQNPEGAYAAVIPRWIAAMLRNEPVHVNGDGSTSRDFCYVANVVQANLLAACTTRPDALNRVYNIATQSRISLSQLFDRLQTFILTDRPDLAAVAPVFQEFRPGDIRHSEADIGDARRLLEYDPSHGIDEGLREAVRWYHASHRGQEAKGRRASTMVPA